MLNFSKIKILRDLIKNNQNISLYLSDKECDIEDVIEYSYDLQTGNYINLMGNEEFYNRKKKHGAEIAKIIESLGGTDILEVGIGEAITLSEVASNLQARRFYGFDISFSRLLCAKKYLEKRGITTELFGADLNNIPLADNSLDVVYTHHSIEPNFGNEKQILDELLRITKRYLILIEPIYELATGEVKKHMEKHRYCRGLLDYLKQANVRILDCRPFHEDQLNKLNPSTLIIVEKNNISGHSVKSLVPYFVSPISKRRLFVQKGSLFCPDDGYLYPIINGIPYLLKSKAILASKFLDY
ncbi:methyltransferase domain-containing protein [Candidatus Babeliales bacterium]|nr:methyltransferase domain-containing protein [Candidatus Babeliales bacterium]